MTKAEFENHCRYALIGFRFTQVLYGEVNYAFDEEQPQEPVRYYHTNSEQLHSLDFSVSFANEKEVVYITWDGTFYQYGLYPFLLTKAEYEAKHEQRWDVSNEPMWRTCLGNSITNLEIVWEDVFDVRLGGEKQHFAVCPYLFVLKLSGGAEVFIGAAELMRNENKAYGLADNILITTDAQLAKQVNLI